MKTVQSFIPAMNIPRPVLVSLLGFAAAITLADEATDFPPKPPVKALSPVEEAKTFQLPKGYHLELVLSEPDILEPVCMAFDGNGRLFVAEMRSYMRDIDGSNEIVPTGRVSVHWSSKHNGVYDQHRIFADKLTLPRLLLPLADGVLIGQTDTNDIYFYRDTKGDGVADEKKLVYQGGARGGNLEHQPSGLTWGIDNWIYSAVNNYRLRWKDGQLTKQDIPGNGGQWGGTQDDDGKFWVVNAGSEKGPINYQQHFLYGQFNARHQADVGFEMVWPAMGLRDFQGGPGRSRDDNTLNHFTATCGGEIYRGDQLPAELKGNLFFGEPVGRLVRRAQIEVNDGITILHNPYPQNEFLRSTDPLFRPVDMKTAPDGTLFICDMYRGIIQEGNWTREGSYLRKVINQYGMDKVINHGRIWRLVHDTTKHVPEPKLLSAPPAQLVATLANPNGWYRDTAQKLLVLKQDQSVVPALTTMVQKEKNPLGRIHALWTLEGLGALTPDLVRTALKDASPQVRRAGIRASESLNDPALQPDVAALAKDSDPSVVIQVCLTAKLMKWKDYADFINRAAMTTPSKGVKEIATQALTNSSEFPRELSGTQKEIMNRGQATYQELCFTCHGLDGRGMSAEGMPPGTTLAPPLANARVVLGHRDGLIRALLHGVTGPVGGKTYQGQMISMATNSDEWIADVLSYIRNRFGNSVTFIEAKDVARVRKETQSRTTPWTEEEIAATAPSVLKNRPEWKLTTSENARGLEAIVDGNLKTKWSSEKPLANGMWISVELPSEETINGLRLAFGEHGGYLSRNVRVETSLDGQTWSKPVYNGTAVTNLTEIAFNPTKAKFIKITQTGGGDKRTPWNLHELDVTTPSALTH
ncbi:coagulation factor 5/8 type domain protein [Chthoniobacter flavus Ellin428]|uniref:Coagulation factor 5/8 type domain protein n=2 Tax=Chthoniobacter flavus TaxID=191863 RepID=B4CYE9_9BACT|nr:coagulation factor 5/8 type domain protein [Chthoniobacter flavus Ellin428]TCO85568.1 mono/diheme cytochrome c family protein [Chthoniobacter flavus]